MDSRSLGLLVIGAGVLIVLIGALLWAGGLGWFGRLPGDVRWEGEHSRVYVPWVSLLLVSVVLSVVLSLLRRWL